MLYDSPMCNLKVYHSERERWPEDLDLETLLRCAFSLDMVYAVCGFRVFTVQSATLDNLAYIKYNEHERGKAFSVVKKSCFVVL